MRSIICDAMLALTITTAAGAEEPDVFNADVRLPGCKVPLADNMRLEGTLEAGYCMGV